MSLTTNLKIILDFVFQNTYLGVNGTFKPSFSTDVTYANGSGLDQSNMLWYDRTPRSLTAGSNDDLDLNSTTVKDAFNTDLQLTILKGLYIKNLSTTAGDILKVGAAASTPVAIFEDTSDIVQIQPGGTFLLDGPSAAGICSVSSGSADVLRINNASSNTITYYVALWGVG